MFFISLPPLQPHWLLDMMTRLLRLIRLILELIFKIKDQQSD